MADELKDQRVVTMMSPTELEAIDEWSFKHRIRSRGEAIRRLCAAGATFDSKSDDIWQLINRVTHEVNRLALETQKIRQTGDSKALHVASVQLSIAALGGMIEVLAAFGPLYMQTSTARAHGSMKDTIDMIKQLGKHFEAFGDDNKSRITEVERMARLIDFSFKDQEKYKE